MIDFRAEDRYCEQVVGDLKKRGHIVSVKGSNLDYDAFGNEHVCNAFHSAFMFGVEVKGHVRQKETIAGYDGPLFTDALHWDLDAEDPKDAQEDLKILLDRLYSMGAEEDNIQVYFSGNKGFHVFFYSVDIREFNGSLFLNRYVKEVCKDIADGLNTFDASVYDRTRLIRVANSKHPKSGLYKIPLTCHEAETLSCEDILEMAKEQVENEYEKEPASIEYIATFLKILKSNGLDEKREVKTSKSTLVDGIYNGFKLGNINNGLTSVAGLLHSRNISEDIVHAVISALNNGSEGPLPDDVIDTIVDSVSRYPVQKEFEEPEVDDIMSMEQAFDRWKYIKENRVKISSGYALLDESLHAFDPGKVMMIAARSGVGKTSLGMQLANNMADSLGGLNLFMSLEMSSQAIFFRAAQIESNRHGENYAGDELTEKILSDNVYKERVFERWNKTKMVDKDGLSINQIEEFYTKAQDAYNGQFKTLLIDYVGLVANTDDYRGLSKVARELKNIAKRLQTRIILLVQLSRGAGDGTIEPRLDMLRDSGSLEEAADMVLGMWVDPGDDRRIHNKFLKNRDGVRGAKFDLIQTGLSYTCEEFKASAVDMDVKRW